MADLLHFEAFDRLVGASQDHTCNTTDSGGWNECHVPVLPDFQ